MLEWEYMPAIEYDGDYISANLVENLLREDLSPVEEARGIKKRITDNNGSQSEAARQLCIGQSRVNKLVHILELPEIFLTKAAEAKIPLNTLVAISREPKESVRQIMMEKALNGDLTVIAAHEARTEKKVRTSLSVGDKFSKTYTATANKFIKNIETIKMNSLTLTDEELSLLQKTKNAIDEILLNKSERT